MTGISTAYSPCQTGVSCSSRVVLSYEKKRLDPFWKCFHTLRRYAQVSSQPRRLFLAGATLDSHTLTTVAKGNDCRFSLLSLKYRTLHRLCASTVKTACTAILHVHSHTFRGDKRATGCDVTLVNNNDILISLI